MKKTTLKEVAGEGRKTMSFRFWLEEITRIHLEDALREAGFGHLDMRFLVPIKIYEKQGKASGVKGIQLDGDERAPSGYLVEHAFLR
jgi:hypothetical protein